MTRRRVGGVTKRFAEGRRRNAAILELIFPFWTCYAEHMEREPPEVARRLMRACRSLNYNRELQPLVEARIERAEGMIRGHLLAWGQTALRLGAFQVEMEEDGSIELTQLQVDGWEQMPLPQPSTEEHGELVFDASAAAGTNTGKVDDRARHESREGKEHRTYVYERAR